MTNGHRNVDIKELVRAGAGELKADLVITNGRLVNVATAEIYPADVAIYDATIIAVGDVSPHTGHGTRVLDATGRYLTPGLIDGHLHMECSKLSVASLAKLLVPLGIHHHLASRARQEPIPECSREPCGLAIWKPRSNLRPRRRRWLVA